MAAPTHTHRASHDWLVFVSIALVVFLSRLPFLLPGYGSDPDAWRVVNTARRIAATGQYSASRLPGYPVHELLSSIIWMGGPLALNGATAMFSGFAVGFFSLLMMRLGMRTFLLPALTLAFTPIVFVSSTMSKDYVWALAFLLGATYFVLIQRPVISGVFLGLAIGTRITSGAMLIPLCLMAGYGLRGSLSVKRIILLVVPAALVGSLAFTPVVHKYGLSFFSFYEASRPELSTVVMRATVGLWGRLGLLALLVALVSLLWSRGGTAGSFRTPIAPAHVVAWAVAVAVYSIAFIRLPHQSAYLIPAIPFVLLLLCLILDRWVFLGLCFAIALSSFLSVGRSGLEPGPIFVERTARTEQMRFVQRIIDTGRALPQRSVIVAGWWYPRIEASLVSAPSEPATYVYSLDRETMQRYQSDGFRVYYLPEMREVTYELHGLDLKSLGAQPLFENAR